MATWNALYLGRQSRIDPNENNNVAEDAADLLGLTFGSQGDPILNSEVSVTTDNRGGSSSALDQTGANDRFITDIGNGARSYRFDAATAYEATITYTDGTTATATVVIFQSNNGHTFMAPGLSPAANVPLTAGPISSITLDSVVQDTASGLAINRPDIDFLACFVRGSLILTVDGYRPVETLGVGDLVMTQDAGAQPLRWVGGRTVDGSGKWAPICFAKGALGNDRDLLVSPQHRMLVTGWRAELLFGEDEILVPAKALINDTTIRPRPMARVSYHHILFDCHQIVQSEGIPSESFYPGNHMLDTDSAMHDEITTLFPELKDITGATSWETARPVLKTSEARILSKAA